MNVEDCGFGRNTAGEATLGGTCISELISQANVPTPAYFYDLSAMEERVKDIRSAFGDAPSLIAYAVKANSAASVVRAITGAGAGIDAVSGGELMLARKLNVEPRKIVLSGVAKRDDEIELAISEDILALQAESVEELLRIHEIAKARGVKARVSIRINPSVLIDSHSHIATGHDAAKFGISQSDLVGAFEFLGQEKQTLELVGLSTHVGSMLKTPDSYLKSALVVCKFAKQAISLGHTLEYVDFGGGFGIDYGDGAAQPPQNFAAVAVKLLREQGLGHLTLVVEPGRSLVGSYGVLIASVLQSKQSGERRWVMIDAGMNDLLRPALYQAIHRIEPLNSLPGELPHRVVGPVCESTDDFGEHPLGPVPAKVVIRDAGAYAFTMASEYNARPLPAEIFVKDGKVVHVKPSPGVAAWLSNRLEA